MRAIILTSPFEKCGIKTYVENLVDAIPPAQIQVDLVRLDRSWPIEVLRLFRRGPRPTVIHCQHEFAFFGSPAGIWAIPGVLFIKVLSFLLRFRIVMTWHTIWTTENVVSRLPQLNLPRWTAPIAMGYLRAYYRLISALCSCVLVPTQEGVETLRSYGVSNARFVPLGSYVAQAVTSEEIARFKRKALGEEPNSTTVLLFGFAFESKGYHHVILAMPSLLKFSPNASLVITAGLPDSDPEQGARYLERLRSTADEVGVKDKIRFLGFIPKEAVPALVSAADVAIFPFDERASGSASLFEVLAYGVPLVTSTARAFDFLEDGRHCLKIDPHDTNALASAIDRVLRDRSLRDSLRANLRDLSTELSITKSARAHVDLYESLGRSSVS